jgi:Zn-dependent protease with chaperone function
MDFFTHQDEARRYTKRLVLLFLIAVLALVALTNCLVIAALVLLDLQSPGAFDVIDPATQHKNISDYFSWPLFWRIGMAVGGVVLCAIVFKWWQLSGGGKCVAESLGGRRVLPNSDDVDEQRLLNVVAEMALASGMPVPPVYLMAHETGINAFAAGNTTADAVIGVTQGALDQFDREQLQGVMAHEFSHILNGDMRLNIRLIALLNGILFIGHLGDMLMRAGSGSRYSSRRGGDGRVWLLGLAMVIIGWLGSLFGGMIKAAVSRQREFLADASAVQFTRNPEGIAEALKIIGGYRPGAWVNNPHSQEVSHLFFGQAISRFRASFDTHPPLHERIRRIEPYWDGRYIERKPVVHGHDEANKKKNRQQRRDKKGQLAEVLAAGAVLSAAHEPASAEEKAMTRVLGALDAIPQVLIKQAEDPFGSVAIACALLLAPEGKDREKQLGYIQALSMKGLSVQVLQLAPEVASLPKNFRLPLLELAMPALKCMSREQYKVFKRCLLLLIRADQRFELFEWCLFQLIRHYVGSEFGDEPRSAPVYKKAGEVAEAYQQVLSLLAYAGHDEQADIERAFSRGANTAGLYTLSLLEQQDCEVDDFIKAVNQLANCYPLLKPRLLKGMTDCITHDGVVLPEEKELLKAIAAVMDCPMPQLGS